MNEAERAAGLAETHSYRYADVVNDQLFVAGQVPLDSARAVVGVGDPRRQAEVCLDNLATLVGVHDFTTADVRRLTVHVVGEHQSLLDAWDGVVAWFGGDVPPATLLGVKLLGHGGQLVEIDAVIMRGL